MSSIEKFRELEEYSNRTGVDNYFFKEELELLLGNCVGKTLGFLDRRNVFSKTEGKPKITGIAGDVVEQSILGLKQNSRQEADLVVDEKAIELKTTGLLIDTKNGGYKAKEPCTITAVSIGSIENEKFPTSAFWHKANSILFVYYLYSKKPPVPSWEYSDFKVISYQFYIPSVNDRLRMVNDWTIVRDFLNEARKKDKPEEEYPKLSTIARTELVVLDIAPKYPNPPRFRIKQKYMTVIVKQHFGDRRNALEEIPEVFAGYEDVYHKLKEIADKDRGKNVEQLVQEYSIPVKEKISKSVTEQIVVRMFGGTASKIGKVELFSAFGLKAKSVAVNKNGGKTEDMKILPVDFDEVCSDTEFEDSQLYHYFADNKFVCVMFQEREYDSKGQAVFAKNEFLGFKVLTFEDTFIETEVRKTWDRIRHLIKYNELVDVIQKRKDGSVMYNKNGTVSTAPNFPKSEEGVIFLRGTGKDSSEKRLVINGIRMLYQNYWIKGTYITNELKDKELF